MPLHVRTGAFRFLEFYNVYSLKAFCPFFNIEADCITLCQRFETLTLDR